MGWRKVDGFISGPWMSRGGTRIQQLYWILTLTPLLYVTTSLGSEDLNNPIRAVAVLLQCYCSVTQQITPYTFFRDTDSIYLKTWGCYREGLIGTRFQDLDDKLSFVMLPSKLWILLNKCDVMLPSKNPSRIHSGNSWAWLMKRPVTPSHPQGNGLKFRAVP